MKSDLHFISVVAGVVWAIAAAAAVGGVSADFVVAPNGDDANPGTVERPFATLDRARVAVAGMAKGGKREIVVMVRGGRYFLEKAVEFGAGDSGTAEGAVVYCGWPGERAIISGGKRLGAWVKGEDGTWKVAVAKEVGDFEQLYINDERRLRPRLPREGYYRIAEGVAATTARKVGKGDDRFRFKAGEFRRDWTNVEDVEVIAFHPWFLTQFHIESIDEKEKIVTFTGKTRTDAGYGKLAKGLRFLVENVKEAMRPGEWYLDRKKREVVYMPLAGEKMETTVAIAPQLETVVVLRGQEKGEAVKHVVFRGLTFAETGWITPKEGKSMSQAAASCTAAISASYADHISIETCTVTRTGGYAIELGTGCRDGRVEGCRLVDLGAGGIKIGSMGVEKDAGVVSRHVVRDNLIAHGGRIHAGGIGVWIVNADHCLVEHNDIYDLYYTGISVGWKWGYGPSGAHDNTIRLNHIYAIGQSVMSDMGGIYTLGVSPGTTLTLNRIHDVSRVTYGGWGIYYDEGTSGIVSENNLVYRTQDGGFHQHFGQENVFRNNILGPSRGGQLTATRITTGTKSTAIQEKMAFTFEHNIIYGWDGANPDKYPWRDLQLKPPRNLYTLRHNLYWNEGKEAKIPGRDKDSVVADPLFADVEHDDYTLKEGSPAEGVGFKRFDVSGAGRVTKEKDEGSWARTYPAADAPGKGH